MSFLTAWRWMRKEVYNFLSFFVFYFGNLVIFYLFVAQKWPIAYIEEKRTSFALHSCQVMPSGIYPFSLKSYLPFLSLINEKNYCWMQNMTVPFLKVLFWRHVLISWLSYWTVNAHCCLAVQPPQSRWKKTWDSNVHTLIWSTRKPVILQQQRPFITADLHFHTEPNSSIMLPMSVISGSKRGKTYKTEA